ncbi:GspH/FimT family protein [Halioxenophilus sp. WMMB6]|uniref:GspH/FimT family protein n=1 Tax=Halioxenophilus sp. WMMB6 TaxID=3073815 RepID=UPI00295E7F36|nr:GspH/FimT family pseudopilin [Halioxenophilus sp. WMMB6]
MPNFTDANKRNRMTTNANEIFTSLQFARTEALRRGGNVSVGPLDGINWVSGIAVFTDGNGNSKYDDGEEIRVWGAFKTGTSLATIGGASVIVFDSRGFAAANDDGSAAPSEEAFKLCDDREGETGRKINLLMSGSVWIGDANDC